MPVALRTSFGQGYSTTAPTELQFFTGTTRAWRGDRTTLIYCHGSGDTATTLLTKSGQRPLINSMAQNFAVIAPDLGLQATWGNDLHVTLIDEAIDYVETTYGTSGRVILVAGSMGTLGALAYALNHPEKVRAVAAIIPGLDLADLMLRGAAADINAAYGGTYDDVTEGPTHSPVQYAGDLDPNIPIHLWTCSNDTITVPATADAFVAARPQTERTNIGALGHTEAAVTAAQASVLDWLADQ